MERKVTAFVTVSPKAECLLSCAKTEGETCGDNLKFSLPEIVSCYYEYPLKIIQPSYASDGICMWLYPITYGGGLVEGDYVSITVKLNENCCVLWTTLSFPKVYICENGLDCQQHCNYTVGSHSLLCVIPDPLICFKKASYVQTQNIYLTSNSNTVLLDWFTSGRYSRGERWEFSKYQSTLSIYIDGILAFKDALKLQSTPFLTLSEAMKSFNISGSCLIIGPDIMFIALRIMSELEKVDGYGQKPKSDIIFAVSPLHFGLNLNLCGCIVKFAAKSVSEAYIRIEELLCPLFDIIGGNPLKNK